MHSGNRRLSIAIIVLAFLSVGVLAFFRGAVGLIAVSGRQAATLPVEGYVASELASDTNSLRDPLIDLVEPVAAYHEDTAFKPTVLAADPVLGEGEVSVVLFCDHVSKACQEAVRVLRQLVGARLIAPVQSDRSDMRVIWKDFPSPLIPQAREAAAAARCAQAQGKFWEYAESLIIDQLSMIDYIGIAQSLGLEREKFEACLSAREPVDLVNRGMEEAQELEVDSVPTVFVGSFRIRGAPTREEVERLVSLISNQ